MTEGRIGRHLISYAIPMILGNILQLTYNAVDAMIIGKCLGETAQAAVSTANPIMTIMVLGASGIGIGASVLISRYYGADDLVKMKREFSTTVILGIALSLAVFILGFTLSGEILSWIKTPPEAFPLAKTYLRIAFVGFLFTFQYNIISSALRGSGDSKTPVKFLGLSCALNIGLDLLLVAILPLGVAGAAIATAISQMASVIGCVVYIYKKVPALRLTKTEFVVDHALLKETLKTGMLTALQQAAQPVGKVLIQRVINVQGIIAIDAFNAVCRLDDFACIPAQSIGSGIMTCTAQNLGAGRYDRVRETLKRGLMIALVYFPIICGVTLLVKKPAVMLLAPDNSRDIVEMGVAYLRVKAWFFIMPCILNAVQGYFRGVGKMRVVLAATVLQISIRTICVHVWVPLLGITGEAYACMAGWACQGVFELLYYLYYQKSGFAADSTANKK